MNTQRGEIKPLYIVIGIAVIIAIAFFASGIFPKSQTSPTETETDQNSQDEFVPNPAPNPTGKFEFRDSSYNMVSDPSQATVIIVNAPGAQAARPIDVVVEVNDEEVMRETISTDKPNCADKDTCSVGIPNRELWTIWFTSKDKVELSATDSANNLLALFSLLGATE